MRKSIIILIFFIVSFILSNCSSIESWVDETFLASEVINAQPTPDFAIPEKNPQYKYLQFIAVGDFGTGRAGQEAVTEEMAEKAEDEPISFVLVLGDNFYESGVESVKDEQWKDKFEDMYDYSSLQVPFYAVLGNHDYNGNTDAQVEYTKKSNRWKMPAKYYTFTYQIDDTSIVQFFGLDTTPMADLSIGQINSKSDTSKYQPQLRWFEKELQKSSARWKIVFGHHPLYSYGFHGTNNTLIALLENLFVNYKVDVYLDGHDHDQQLLKPVKGVYYIISGAGSKHRDVTWTENTIFAMTNLGFTFYRLSSKDLLVEFLNKEGKVCFAYTIPSKADPSLTEGKN